MSLKKNTLWNLAGSGLPLLAAAAFIPYTFKQLGNEAFGVLTLIWALIGYFSLFDMGVGRALTYELSKLQSEKKQNEITPTLKAGLILTALTGFLGGVTMLLIAPQLVHDWLKISNVLRADAQLSFQIAALGVIPTTITSGLRGALEGLDRFAASNVNRIYLGFCMFALPAASIFLHGSTLWQIALYLVAARFIAAIAASAQLRKELSHSQHSLKKTHLRSLLNYGIWITVSGIISPLMVYGDRFFVSAAVGAAELPPYAISQEGLQRLLIIPAALCGALLPRFATSRGEEIMNIYKSSYKQVALVMFSVCSLAALLAYPSLAWWLSIDFAQKALPIVLILSIGIWINSIALVPFTLIQANGNPKLTAIFHIIELSIYLIALWWLTTQFGLVGAAIAWVGRVTMDFILLQYAAKKIMLQFLINCEVFNKANS
jgi:O-antigen/teichoic acid export membrane protein